jgi:hypothetical protein
MMIRHILQYLSAHPEAKDTLQGIIRWWLPGDLGAWEAGEVQEALDALVTRGWLTWRGITPSHSLYGMNREKLAEIERFLRESMPEEP